MNNTVKEQIQKIIKHQKLIFALYWVLIIGGIIIGEAYSDVYSTLEVNPKDAYIAETIIILATAGVIPLALKLFGTQVGKLDWVNTPLNQCIQAYSKWSTIRLGLLSLVAFASLVIHYIYLSSGAGFCTLIISFATFFCIPGKAKLESLIVSHQEKNDENENTPSK